MQLNTWGTILARLVGNTPISSGIQPKGRGACAQALRPSPVGPLGVLHYQWARSWSRLGNILVHWLLIGMHTQEWGERWQEALIHVWLTLLMERRSSAAPLDTCWGQDNKITHKNADACSQTAPTQTKSHSPLHVLQAGNNLHYSFPFFFLPARCFQCSTAVKTAPVQTSCFSSTSWLPVWRAHFFKSISHSSNMFPIVWHMTCGTDCRFKVGVGEEKQWEKKPEEVAINSGHATVITEGQSLHNYPLLPRTRLLPLPICEIRSLCWLRLGSKPWKLPHYKQTTGRK